MASLVDELAQLIVQDNAVLFVGSDLRAGADQSSPVRQIADALAARIDYSGSDRSLPAVAQDFETLHGRAALIQAIRNELDKASTTPAPIHQLIADAVLPKTKVITTRFDQTIEQALEQFAKPYVLIVKDKDAPFFDESRVTLIKMQGDVRQPDSLIITEDDIDTFISRLPTLSDIIRAFFATKTLVFLGYDLESEHFKRFYTQVTHNLGEYRRTAYAIVPEPLDEVKNKYWEQRNVTVSVQEPTAFLEQLADVVKAEASTPAATPSNPLVTDATALPEAPYKGLNPFTREDSAIFYGRNEERHRLVNRILANRMTVLHGEAGVGKTSLLYAGAAPLLAEQRALLVNATPAADTSLADRLHAALQDAGADIGLEEERADSMPALIRTWQRALGGQIVLAVDDFEQIFLLHGQEARDAAIQSLHEIHTDRSLDVRLVLIMREDFLGRLQNVQSVFGDARIARFRLERLSRENARAAIEEPADKFDIRWEPALVNTLLDVLYEGTSGGIGPAQLQLVCKRLHSEATTEPEDTRRNGTVITLELLERLGGTETILGDYLERALMAIPEAHREPARALLATLVSSSGVAQRLALGELARRTEMTPEDAEATLNHLVQQQLVRCFEPADQAPEYELTHSYLATNITDWLDEGFWAAQRAYEILQQTLPAWQENAALPAPGDLRHVHGQRARIQISEDAAHMLYAAAVAYDGEPAPWADVLSPDERCTVLLQLLRQEEALVRANAVHHILPFATPDHDSVITALVDTAVDDDAERVRTAAAETLVAAGTRAPENVTIAVPALADAYETPATSASAHRVLVKLRDQVPAVEQHLPDSLKTELRRSVWRTRWQRNRERILTATIRGAQGGFWGLALGMGLFIGPLDAAASGFDRINLRALLQLASLGLPIAGLMGAFAGGASTFAGSALRNLQDENRPTRTWALMTLVSMVVLGLGFLLLTYVFFGEPRPLQVMGAGLLIGAALGGVATAPLRLPRIVHLAIAAGAGVVAFVLVHQLGLTFESSTLAGLTVMGAASGIGFFLGMRDVMP